MKLIKLINIKVGSEVVIIREGKKDREAKVINTCYEDMSTVLIEDGRILTVPNSCIYVREV